MGIKPLDWVRQQQENWKPGAQAAPAPAPKEGFRTFIAPGAEFEGRLTVASSIRIDGAFRGELISQDTVVVGEDAGIEANIRARNVIVRGAVAGDVLATRELLVTVTGRLKGNVETPSLMVEKGAVFNGRMKMGRPEMAVREKRAAQGLAAPRRAAPLPAAQAGPVA